MKILLGKKIGMTQLWDDKGRLLGATVILVEPNKIVKAKGRQFLATGIAGKTNKAQQHFATSVGSKRGVWVKEVSTLETDQEKLDVSLFSVGEEVKVAGVTKGKGFAGGMKRHGFHGGPKTHGGDNQRGPGSIGAQRPQRVPKGQKMAGHMGSASLTVRGGKVLAINPTTNTIIISGNIPGPARARVVIEGVANG